METASLLTAPNTRHKVGLFKASRCSVPCVENDAIIAHYCTEHSGKFSLALPQNLRPTVSNDAAHRQALPHVQSKGVRDELVCL